MLPELPSLTAADAGHLADDYQRFADQLPARPREQILGRYGIDIAGEYAGYPLDVPFGKASGQLSLNLRQVEQDAAAGLGFVVLKTVIAQDEAGAQSMAEWAIDETRMRVEPIAGRRSGEAGWTVTWKGRGWSGSFDEYLALLDACLGSEVVGAMPVAASVKYHLPVGGEPYRAAEYRYTTRRLQEAWRRHRPEPLLLEKDFSPTLAGDDRSAQREQILAWLRHVPGQIRAGADGPVKLGVKVMNCLSDDDFQVEMLAATADSGADYLIYANRLFDPEREFEGKRGVAYGGPDLSHRNLAVLAAARAAGLRLPPISATGNILTGRTAVEYALLGCTSFQMHTLFQLPDRLFDGRQPSRSARALHRLLYHPEHGLIAWLLHFRGEADGLLPLAHGR